jgi:hypothetical protein
MRKLTVKTGEPQVFNERPKKKDKRKDRGRGSVSWKTLEAL